MDFTLTDEQRGIVEVTRAFVERELLPHEEEVERTGVLRPELAAEIRRKALAAGLYAANMPEEVGGAGLDTVTWVLFEKELGKASYALHYTGVARPSNILLAGYAGPAGALPAPLRARRAHRLPGHDRARGGLRHAGHPHARRAHRRRLEHPRHEALHQPRRRGRLRDPAGTDGVEHDADAPACRCSWSTWTPPG